MTMNTYIATIKWKDNGEIQENMVLRVGDDIQDDDDVFYYVTDEEIERNGTNEWEIIKLEKIQQTKTTMENKIIDDVIEQIKEDISMQDLTAIYELLEFIPKKNLSEYLNK